MSMIQGIVLGVFQGIAEFLPISSSGHLAVLQHLFGLEDVPLLFDVFLHLATLLSVVLFFRKKIWELLCSFARILVPAKKTDEVQIENQKENKKYILAIILATIVTGIMGVISSKFVENVPVRFICAGFIVTAVLLVLSSVVEKKSGIISGDEKKSVTWIQALIIGFAQGVGTLPGISRSGSTISGALFCGVPRSRAGEFSFIVSIPAILGAFILEAKDLGEVASSIGFDVVIAGCAAAFASGYLSLTWLMKLIKKGRLEWFACYLVPAGVLGMIFLG
ncbi:MAG: undecaprenyl-diphosphate phosphatase [Treponema sp.]|nr:undecaprenyl-diphosphate phosphatase [Treponema sp.]